MRLNSTKGWSIDTRRGFPVQQRFFRFAVLVVLWASPALAQTSFSPGGTGAGYHPTPPDPLDVYYAIHDPTLPIARFQGPAQMIDWRKLAETTVNLLQFDFYQSPFPPSPEHYDRKHHFGTWVRDPRDHVCYDTRAKVLMRDSKQGVVYKQNNHCVVDSGLWQEPYTGQTHTQASTMQIDHLVPLKNAFTTGAWRWDWLHRCLYANYMGFPLHLVSADGSQNMRKGDHTPADWMPPNKVVACTYLASWLQVKIVWGLVLSRRESEGVQALARQLNCDARLFEVRSDFPVQQRQIIAQNLNLCANVNPGFGDEPGDAELGAN